ncbi:tripartite tricarboxylate transporter substrate-binding protein [Oribacterium sp. WCC10]|uniref:tripartite tricarboxylate transporter substrate-binding protein n=1 Tax=Oribacterium sp. WCC10 TaxID=1855343 RepID=UPI0008E8F246|nr:tripartite tricarboxylate transporter substrate-binding protein [Oribacterium sp. WCC10]SFG63356.1 Tripartite-type tricarboxylate transporter, receptor component TctC [Oribacterium sp. WCC10]
MRKQLLAGILATAMAASLAACGSSSAPSAATEAAKTEAAKTESAAETKAEEKQAATGSGETVKVICPYGVGGTADIIARKFAEVATKTHPEYNFIVEQQTGGDGFAAATAFTQEDPSTTDLLVYGYGVAYRHDLGKQFNTEVVDFDRSEILPLATVDDRTWILYTTPDQTLGGLIEKAKSGGLKMSGGNPLSDPHLALGSLLAQEGGKVMVVPYDGGAAQKKGLTDGEVDCFVGTTQAAQEDVEAGNLIPVLAFSDKAFTGFKGPQGDITVPSLAGADMAADLDASKDYTKSILPAGGSLATRKGASQEWQDAVVQVAKDVWATDEYKDFIASIMLNDTEIYGQDDVQHYEDACKAAVEAFKLLSGQN